MKYFKKELAEINKWEHLRKNLYNNEEVNVELIAMTKPLNEADWITSESLPGFTARQSHESKGSYDDDIELNKKLISWNHITPLESIQFVFHVTGISKSLAGQWTRHRAGIGWTFRSTRYVSAEDNKFIYPALEYIDNEEKVSKVYESYERAHMDFADTYKYLKGEGVKNQELRRLMPVGFSTAAYCYVNARALRHFFELRLSKHAEWEIRRMAYLTFNTVMNIAPSIFEDLL
jgi:thymidylate synthase (FAD)